MADYIKEEQATIKINVSTEGSKIHYEENGNIPNSSSPEWNGDMIIHKNKKFRAIAMKDGCLNSDVVSCFVDIKLPTPLVQNNNDNTITIANKENFDLYGDVTFYLEKDDSGVVESHSENVIAITGNGVYKVVAKCVDNADSDEGVLNVDNLKVALPVIKVDDSDETFNAKVFTVTCATKGATIRYTLDGSEPTEESIIYTSPVEVVESCTVKARAFKEYFIDSDVGEVGINIQEIVEIPLIKHNDMNNLITITCGTEGATIRYTLDGSEPNEESTIYTDGFSITEDTKISAKAWKEGCIESKTAIYNAIYIEPLTYWTKVDESSSAYNKRDALLSANGKLINLVINSSNIGVFAVSENGIDWTFGSQTFTYCNISKILYDGEKYIGAINSYSGGSRQVKIMTSEDGLNWTGIYTFTKKQITYDTFIFADGAYYISFDSLGDDSEYFIYRSVDCLEWEQISIGAGNLYLTAIAYGNGKFVATFNNSSNGFAISDDGLDWSIIANPLNRNKQILSCKFVENRFFALGTFSIHSSIDGVNWTELYYNNIYIQARPLAPCDVTYGNGVYAFLTSSSTIVVSFDCAEFIETVENPLFDNTSYSDLNIAFINNRFVVTNGYGSEGCYCYSDY